MATNAIVAGGMEEPRDERDRREERPRDERPAPKPEPGKAAPRGPGFFTIYKRGQGYWTRMGTAVGALLLGALTAYNLYTYLPALMDFGPSEAARKTMSAQQIGDAIARGARLEQNIAIGVALGFAALFGFFAWRMMNKPANVDFLIATDSEMKKVNWTSRKDLIGSTKVVIIFMFLIAFFLFVIDIVFSYFFFLINVLKSSPFGGGGTIGGG